MEFLSEAWVTALDRAAEGVEVDSGVELSIDYRSGDFTYRVAVSGGRVQVTTDLRGSADVRITADPAMATAIRRGQRSALEGFMDGDVTVGGNIKKVMDHQDLLVELGGIFSSVQPDPG